MRRLLDNFKDKPVVYLGVCGDSKREQGLQTATQLKMPCRNFWDGKADGPNGSITTAWRVNGWPALFVIDGDGLIRYKFWGKEQIDAELESAINSLLAETPPRP